MCRSWGAPFEGARADSRGRGRRAFSRGAREFAREREEENRQRVTGNGRRRNGSARLAGNRGDFAPGDGVRRTLGRHAEVLGGDRLGEEDGVSVEVAESTGELGDWRELLSVVRDRDGVL